MITIKHKGLCLLIGEKEIKLLFQFTIKLFFFRALFIGTGQRRGDLRSDTQFFFNKIIGYLILDRLNCTGVQDVIRVGGIRRFHGSTGDGFNSRLFLSRLLFF